LAYGQSRCGKTHSLLGDITFPDEQAVLENKGVQLLAIEQLFSVTNQRSDRYKDVFSLSIVEVYNERVSDLLSGTASGDQFGEIVMAENVRRKKSGVEEDSSNKATKLEIRCDVHGETVVQGLLSVKVDSFEHVCAIWKECLSLRRIRLLEQAIDPVPYEAASHIIATLKVKSVNIATGLGSTGKAQFVDLAGADLVQGQPSIDNKATPSLQELTSDVTGDKLLRYKFEHRSIEKFGEVLLARSQYARSVPYRNATLTHLLSDSLEHDTKVVLLACISSDVEDAQETASALRLASRARRVWTGKATKHALETTSLT
jgi:hypothetical protein